LLNLDRQIQVFSGKHGGLGWPAPDLAIRLEQVNHCPNPIGVSMTQLYSLALYYSRDTATTGG